MPDHTTLKVGDTVRLLCVPSADVEQRQRELRDGLDDAGWTADTIERIIAQDPIVTVNRIDEYRYPWFDYKLKCDGGEVEEHTLAIMEDESWEIA